MTTDTTNVFFVQLSNLTNGRPFDGLAAGTFRDMWGREVTFKPEELPEYVKNTVDAINVTLGEDGSVAGLPIDLKNHEMGDAAGWIVGAELDESGTKIRFTPNWTDAGLELIRQKLQRFFSATINIKSKTIVGGTLTNWPATRDQQGKVMLRPIALSSELFWEDVINPDESETTEGVKPMTVDTLDVEQVKSELMAAVRAEMTELIKQSSPASPQTQQVSEQNLLEMLQLSGAKEEVVEAFKATMLEQYERMQESAKIEAQQMIAAIRHESNVAQFSEKVTAGTQDNPYGLPVKSQDLREFLMSLNPAQAQKAMALFTAVWQNSKVEFAELGSNHDAEIKKQLPPEIVSALNTGKLTLEMLSSPTLALGDLDQYDLSKWLK